MTDLPTAKESRQRTLAAQCNPVPQYVIDVINSIADQGEYKCTISKEHVSSSTTETLRAMGYTVIHCGDAWAIMWGRDNKNSGTIIDNECCWICECDPNMKLPMHHECYKCNASAPVEAKYV